MTESAPDYGLKGTSTSAPLPVVEDLPPPEIRGRSPILAGILSAVLPGAGHIYAGQKLRGAAFMLLFALMLVLIYWARVTHEFKPFAGLIEVLVILTVLFWAWVLVSAVKAAQSAVFLPAVGLALVLGFTYLLGWQAIEPNMQKFFSEFGDIFGIFTRVMWPWEAALEYPEERVRVGATWLSPCPAEGAVEGANIATSDTGQTILIEPGCGDLSAYILGEGLQPGTEITISGTGFDPNDTIELYLRDEQGNDVPVIYNSEEVVTQSDDEGNFSVTFNAPQPTTTMREGRTMPFTLRAEQVASVGDPVLSQDFILAVNRILITIFQALMATSFGIILAIPFSFLAARNLMWGNAFTRMVYYAVRFVMNVTRSIEPIIWAIIAAVWVGLGPFAGVIALTLHSIASLGKLYSEAIESIDAGPIEALTATGANRLQTIMYAIVPQVIPPFLSFTIYRWDINVRMSTILGFVGGGGIGQVLQQWINTNQWRSAGIAVWMIALTVTLMDYASSEIRKRFI